MSKLDVRVKLLILSVLSLLAVFYQTPLPLTLLLCTAVGILIVLRIPCFMILRRLKPLLKLVIVMALIQSIFAPSKTPIFTIYGLPILSLEGIYHASVFLLRMLVIICSACILTSSSPRELMQGMIQLHIPYQICLMAIIGIKFIPTLRDYFNDTFTAMELRGINIKEQKLRNKITLIAQLLMPVVTTSIQSARSTAITLQLRGFGTYEKRTSFYTLQFTWLDYTILILTIIYLLSFIALSGGLL